MAGKRRSPFGELVRRHRRGLKLTQLQLASSTAELRDQEKLVQTREDTDKSDIIDAVSIAQRTLQSYEEKVDPARWVRPRAAAVRTLVAVFGLEAGSPEYNAFIEAGNAIARDAPPTTSPDRSEVFVAAGREPHIARLRQLVDNAAAGTPGVGIVTADPGTGKTWLIEEICRESVERHPELIVVWANCTGRSGAMDLHQPLRQLMGLMVGDVEMASERQLVSAANRSRLIARIPDAISAIDSDAHVLVHRCISNEALRNPHLAAIEDAAVARRVESLREVESPIVPVPSETSDQLFDMLAGYTGSGPVVLVLEDLHWADASTIGVVSHLLRRLHKHPLPLLVIGSSWPSGMAGIGPERRHRLQSLMHLAPRLFPAAILDLSTAVGGAAGRAFVDAMIAQMGQDVSQDDADQLFQKTKGVPLLVSIILRAHEREMDGDQAEIGDWVGSMPSGIRLMFADRVGRLSTDALRTVLMAASVQGNAFSAEALMKALDLSRAEFIDMVDMKLVQEDGLLRPGGRITIAGKTVHEYQFFHTLLRDYIYDDLMDELERAHYHIATAEALIALYGPTGHHATDVIAFHFDRGGDSRRAAVAYLHAGEHAMNRRDFDRATRHFEQVGKLRIRRSDPATFIQSLIGLGNCARCQGNPDRARRLLEQARELAVQQEFSFLQGSAMESLALVDFDEGEMQAGVDRMTAVIDLWLAAGHDDAGRAMANLSYLLHGMGRYEEAISYAERGMAMASRLGDDSMWIDAALGVAACWMDIGLYDEAVATYTQCIARCREAVDTHRGHICWANIALAEIERERWEHALAVIERELIGAPELGAQMNGVSEFNLGLIAEGRHDPALARRHYQTSREIRARIGQQKMLVDSLAGLLRVAVSEKDRDAITSLRSDIQGRIEDGDLDGIEHIGKLFVALIGASMALGDVDGARACAWQATSFVNQRADQIGDPSQRASYLNVPARRRMFELAAATGVRTDGRLEGAP